MEIERKLNMMKKWTVALLVSLFAFSSVSFAEDWVYIGEDQKAENANTCGNWLDVDSIVPLGEMTNRGVVASPFAYRFTYRTGIAGDEAAAKVEKNVVVDFKAKKTLAYSSWVPDTNGLDEFDLSAYLIRDFKEIQKRDPFYEQMALRSDGEPEKVANDKGWQQVYEIKNLGKAWIQVKSVQLSSLDQELPKVRVLVRYQPQDKPPYYSYEEYRPETRERKILAVWGENGRYLLFQTQRPYKVQTLSPEAAIATTAYSIFILDPTLFTSRPSFTDKDYTANIPEDWKKFGKK